MTASLVATRRVGWGRVGDPATFVVAIVVGEWVRSRIPFGGVPLALVSNGQVDAPYALTASVGGPLLLSAVTAACAVALHQAARHRTTRSIAQLASVSAVVVLVCLTGWSAAARSSQPESVITVAIVQGGGEVGTRARDTDSTQVFAQHVRATSQLPNDQPIDLILWPENALALSGKLAGSAELETLKQLSESFDAPISVGVTERENPRQFRNAQVLIDSSGEIGRYEKVERVPFGEWIPLRTTIDRLVDLSAIPRDAIVGSGSGTFDETASSAANTVGMTISYEVYFSERGRAAVNDGAQWLNVPTNASSYVTTDVTAATLDAARLQAISLDRPTVQVAPTGWSAKITNRGDVSWRTQSGETRTSIQQIERRSSRTIYSRIGDSGVVVISLATLATLAISRLRRKRR